MQVQELHVSVLQDKGHIAKSCKKQRGNVEYNPEGNWRTQKKPKTLTAYQVDAEDVTGADPGSLTRRGCKFC